MDFSPVVIFFAVVALVWTLPVVLGAILGRRASSRGSAFVRAGAIAYGIGFLFALVYVIDLFILLPGIWSGKLPVGDILLLVTMWGVIPGIMAGLVAYIAWKPLPNSHSPLAQNLECAARARFVPHLQNQDTDAIRATRQEMTEWPAQD